MSKLVVNDDTGKLEWTPELVVVNLKWLRMKLTYTGISAGESNGKIRPLTPAELNADAMLEILQDLDTKPDCTCDLCVKTRAVLATINGGGEIKEDGE